MLPPLIRRASNPRPSHVSAFSIDQHLQHLCQQGHLEQALHFLSSEDTSVPSYRSYLFLLKACSCSKSLVTARLIHAHLALRSLHLTDSLGNPLVVALSKCGALEEALTLLYSLAHRTVISWTAVISAYTDCGRASEALQTHIHMLDDGIQPDLYTFVSLFKACGSLCNLVEGMQMHADACCKGFTSSVFAGSSLVSMYGKCQSLAEAEKVFVEMLEHDMVSWSAMLSVYVDMGFGKKALQLYRQMHNECQSPVKLLLVLALQACGLLEEDDEAFSLQEKSVKLVAFDIGQALHAEARKRELISDPFIGSALVNMYGKCGSTLHAENVFFGFSMKDLATWNSMLSAYVEQGQAIKALLLYKQLCEEGMTASKVTLVIALQACAILAENEEEVSIAEGNPTKVVSLHLIEAFHDDAVKEQLTSDIVVGSALVSVYGKCGKTLESENIFCGMAQRNVVSWTAMVSAYLEQGEGIKALQLYRQMLNERMSFDQHVYVLGIQACSILLEKPEILITGGVIMVLGIGQALHSEVRTRGFAKNIHICSALISMYSKCESIAKAENVFNGLSIHNVVSWTAMLSAYADQGEELKALQVYHQMQKEGINPDGPAFILALQACSTLGEKEDALLQGHTAKLVSLQIGKGLHADCKRLGLASDIFVASALVGMYGKCGAIVDAENVFKPLPQLNTIMCGSMLSLYIEQGLSERALHLYKHMCGKVELDDAMLFCIMKACSDTGSLEVCKQVYFSLVSTGFDSSLMLANTLIHAYGSCASMLDGQVVADGLPQPDMVSWSACMAGYAQYGSNVTGLQMLLSMQLEGSEPGGMTFLSLLTSCSHMGLIDEGFDYFESMSRDFGIALDPKHYLVLTDLLGRAGDFKRLEHFMHRSPMIANVSIWLVLLGACFKHGNIELGEHAFCNVMDLEPKKAAAYVLMANLYTDTRGNVEEPNIGRESRNNG